MQAPGAPARGTSAGVPGASLRPDEGPLLRHAPGPMVGVPCRAAGTRYWRAECGYRTWRATTGGGRGAAIASSRRGDNPRWTRTMPPAQAAASAALLPHAGCSLRDRLTDAIDLSGVD